MTSPLAINVAPPPHKVINFSHFEGWGHSYLDGAYTSDFELLVNSGQGGGFSRLARMFNAEHVAQRGFSASLIAHAASHGGWAKFYQTHFPPTRVLPGGTNPGNRESLPYIEVGVLWTGLNDLESNYAHNVIINAMRACLARWRTAWLFEDGDASITYNGTGWSTISSTTENSGTSYRQTTSSAATISIGVPSWFPGGVVNASFICDPSGPGAIVTLREGATVLGTIDTRNNAPTGTKTAHVVRSPVLSAGAHNLTLSFTSFNTNVKFDCWGIEANEPSIILIPNQPELPPTVTTLVNSPPRIPQFNANLLSLASEFDRYVQVVDLDSRFARQTKYFYSTTSTNTNAEHPNDAGHALAAKLMREKILSLGQLTRNIVRPGLSAPSYTNTTLPLTHTKGQIIYNSTTGQLNISNGSTWGSVSSPASPVTLNSAAVGQVPLTLTGMAGQTANLLNITNDVSGSQNRRFEVTKDGNITLQGATGFQGIFQTFLDGDTQPRAMVTTGGILFGPGGSTALDVVISRQAANVLQTDDQFRAVDGIKTKTIAGSITDGGFTAVPIDGTLAVNTTSHILNFRSGGTWRPIVNAVSPFIFTAGANNQVPLTIQTFSTGQTVDYFRILGGNGTDVNWKVNNLGVVEQRALTVLGNASRGFNNFTDANPAIETNWVTAGAPTVKFGAGGATAPDVEIGRGGANILLTPDQLRASDGLVTKSMAGPPTDASFTVAPTDGGLAVDTTGNSLYYRANATWHPLSQSATPATLEAFGHSLTPQLAEALAREMRTNLDDYSQGAAHIANPEGAAIVGNNWGGHARVLKELDRRAITDPNQYLYMPQSEISLVWYGLNDLPWLGPSNLGPVQHALRTVLSRIRSSIVYEELDSTIAYTGTWANDTIFMTTVASGGGPTFGAGSGNAQYTSTGTAGTIQINVPSTFAGGRIALGFIANANGDGTNWQISVDGGAAATHNTTNLSGFNYGSTRAATGKALNTVHRTAILAPGAHTINISMTSRTGNAYFDYWQVEPNPALLSNNLPVILVLNNPRPYSYTSYNPWPYNAAAGLSDANIATLNTAIQSVVNEFDSRVVYVDVDSTIAKQQKYFKVDGLHLNQFGIGACLETVLPFIKQRIDILPRGYFRDSRERYYMKASEGQSGGFLNSWVDFVVNTGPGTDPPMSWRRDADGKMYVRGSVKSGSSATATVMNFEAERGFRPRHPVTFPIDGNGTQGMGRLETNGDLKFITNGSTTKTNFNFTYHGES